MFQIYNYYFALITIIKYIIHVRVFIFPALLFFLTWMCTYCSRHSIVPS